MASRRRRSAADPLKPHPHPHLPRCPARTSPPPISGGPVEAVLADPFRAQRALIRTMLKRDAARQIRVSTVHRSQGSESKIVIFDPVDAGGSFLNSSSGRRLINVAASRAQAHLIVVANDKDLQNPWIKTMHGRARALWHRAGSYAEPLHVKLRSY